MKRDRRALFLLQLRPRRSRRPMSRPAPPLQKERMAVLRMPQPNQSKFLPQMVVMAQSVLREHSYLALTRPVTWLARQPLSNGDLSLISSPARSVPR